MHDGCLVPFQATLLSYCVMPSWLPQVQARLLNLLTLLTDAHLIEVLGQLLNYLKEARPS